MSNVKLLLEKYDLQERNGGKKTSSTQLADEQRKACDADARDVLEKRKKAAVYNLSLHSFKLRCKRTDQQSPSNRNGGGDNEMKIRMTTADASEADNNNNNDDNNSSNGNSDRDEGDITAEMVSSRNENNLTKLKERAKSYGKLLEEELDESNQQNSRSKSKDLLEDRVKKASQIIFDMHFGEVRIGDNKNDKSLLYASSSSCSSAGGNYSLYADGTKSICFEDDYERCLLSNYLEEICPSKANDVEILLKEFKGHLDILFEELVNIKKPAVDTSSSAAQQQTSSSSSLSSTIIFTGSTIGSQISSMISKASSDSDAKSKDGLHDKSMDVLDNILSFEGMLSIFYSVYAPSKVADVPVIMNHFENREGDLIHSLELKFDVTFMTDGSCIPNNAAIVGDPFPMHPKFGNDLKKHRLLKRLKFEAPIEEEIKDSSSQKC